MQTELDPDKNKSYRKDILYMNIARAVANQSYAKKRKVGAITVKDGSVIAIGYNGTPSGWDNTCEDENNKTYPWVLHAELNMVGKLSKLTISSYGSTVYVTTAPCLQCAILMSQIGIEEVVYEDDFKNNDGIYFLNKCNVRVRKLERAVIDVDFNNNNSLEHYRLPNL